MGLEDEEHDRTRGKWGWMGGNEVELEGNGVGLKGERDWTGKGNMVELGGNKVGLEQGRDRTGGSD